jgi:diguanylate cyclase (GGDEF)-like protein
MATILLLVHSGAERGILRRHIGGEHRVLEAGSGDLPGEGFDAAIVDSLSFNRRQREIEERKKRDNPALLPVLLLADPKERTVYSSELGRLIEDIILPPVQKKELETKLHNLLRLRELTASCRGSGEETPAQGAGEFPDRALHACSAASRAVLRAESESGMLRDVCLAVTDKGGYPLAWIGSCEDSDEEMLLQARAGREAESIPAREDENGRSRLASRAAHMAAREQRPVVLRNVASEETTGWRDLARSAQCSSALGLPLIPETGPPGVLVLLSTDAGGFEPQETEILERMAEDVAYGMGTLRERWQCEGSLRDVSQMAFYDELTRLPNREHLKQTLESTIASLKRDSRSGALLYIDLDSFKAVNDDLGHRFGDVALHQVARRLSKVVRETDFLARVGGDEFVLLLEHRPRCQEPDNREKDLERLMASAEKAANRLLGALKEPFTVQGREYRLNGSIGISLYPYHDVDGRSLINKADLAMYEAKKTDSGSYAFYSSDFSRRRTRRLILETGLRRALKNKKFLLHYQPIFDFRTGSVQGVEALLRWNREQDRLILPEEFLPVAKRTGLINDIDAWVVSRAFSQLAEWKQSGLTQSLSVNVSASRFLRPEFADDIARAVGDAGIDPADVCLEISEEIMHADPAFLENQMHGLREQGFRIAIDDFGTGYSCLAALHRLPVDALKIDRSFVLGLEASYPHAPIIRSILNLAGNLGLQVVAEGVETWDQYRCLRELGCDSGQGYCLFSPGPTEAISDMLRRGEEGRRFPAASTDRA